MGRRGESSSRGFEEEGSTRAETMARVRALNRVPWGALEERREGKPLGFRRTRGDWTGREGEKRSDAVAAI